MRVNPPDATPDQTLHGRWLVLVALLVLSYNLRPTATQIGPVLPDLQRDLAMDPLVAGLLTSLPTLCFAVFGVLAPALARSLGTHRLITLSVLALCLGSIGRTFVQSTAPFILLSTLALAGLAIGNILAPSIVRHHFPDRVGLVTALYSLVLSVGVTVSSALTVPMATALGGWRQAYLSSTSVAVLALIPWLALLRKGDFRPVSTSATGATTGSGISLRDVARTPLGWAMVVFFGLQSTQAYSLFGWLPTIYMDAGLSQSDAGWMLGIMTALGIPLAFLLPAYLGRNQRPLALQAAICLCGTAGYVGLMVAPARMPWLWASLAAIGTASFPIVLALFGLKARTSGGTAALSGFGQSGGYLIALFGPFLMAALYTRTGTWTASLWFLLVANLVMGAAGIIAMLRPKLEDELGGVDLARTD